MYIHCPAMRGLRLRTCLYWHSKRMKVGILELLHKYLGNSIKEGGLHIALKMPVRKAEFTPFFDDGRSNGGSLG